MRKSERRLSMNLKTLGLIPKSLRISGSWSQCATKKACRLPMNRSAELQLGAVWRAPNAPTWRSALRARRSWCQCAPEKTSRLSLKLAAVLASLVVMKGVTSIACAATFTASLDRDTITIGERATLSLRVEGAVPADIPVVPNVPGLSFAASGQSSQLNIVNGQRSSVVAYNFLVRPAQPGDYTIPAVSVVVDAKTLTSQPLKLKVVKAGEA